MTWAEDAIFYHVYPLGALGAPARNDFVFPPVPRLDRMQGWLDSVVELGATAVYLGPVFESTSHGYDTADYFTVDRRLGTNETLTALSRAMHAKGLRVVLDAVFNHVGRDFWAFRDLQARGAESAYRDWFFPDFERQSPYGDPFSYRGWQGHYELVRLNTNNPAVREHLFAAVRHWIEDFEIDGLRIDAASDLDVDFQRELAAFCRSLRPGFWLVGEVIHGDYRKWANPQVLDSVTNYQLSKALYSSLNDSNYFEVAYTLNRQSGPEGMYRDLSLYTFADNHDVDRIVSQLREPAHLYPLYGLLFTSPGIPSIYYGSEFGIPGRRTPNDDSALRAPFDLAALMQSTEGTSLRRAIIRLALLRKDHAALRTGSYQQLLVAQQQFAFLRTAADEQLVVCLNADSREAEVTVRLPAGVSGRLVDLLDEGHPIAIGPGEARVRLHPRWIRVLRIDAGD
ncbi:MAG TPA: alpha-amylase family glycosyl hydrolase [Tepidiformaceae bacterium]